MYTLDAIRTLHLEVTSHCNAACPQCPRTPHIAGHTGQLPLVHLSLAQVRSILEESFLRQLTHLYLCGNYGDPAACPELLDILEYFRNSSPHLRIGLSTNGGLRDAAWWARVAARVSYCRFAIDGDGDTNHLYRRRVRWPLVLSNARSYIEAGGRAEWVFIAFRHNEHQIPDLTRLARTMGFSRFIVKRTHRFSYLGSTADLQPPINPLLRHPGALPMAATPSISCRATTDASLYVSAQGLVLPCCYLAHIYVAGEDWRAHPTVRLVIDTQGTLEALSALHRPLRDIVASPLFQEAIPRAWSLPVGSGGMAVCDRVCGSTRDAFSDVMTIAADYNLCD